MRTPTVKVYVNHVSMETLEENGVEFGTEEKEFQNSEDQIQREYLNKLLTKKQIKLLSLLVDEEMSRKEAAKALNIHIQAVHQMVLRIRKRLKQKGYKT